MNALFTSIMCSSYPFAIASDKKHLTLVILATGANVLL